jgi:hypothetical protein
MNPALVLAHGVSDITGFGQPSNRPPRPRRRAGATGPIGAMLRSIGHELARAVEAADAVAIPRITNYPY